MTKMPKSQIEITLGKAPNATIELPEWLAKEKDLI